jgi:hypothetical protein
MTELQNRLCPACQIVVAGLLAKIAKSDPSGSVPVQKADLFGNNLGTQRTPDTSRPVNLSEALGVGQNAESPQRAALRKREENRVKNACKALFRL